MYDQEILVNDSRLCLFNSENTDFEYLIVGESEGSCIAMVDCGYKNVACIEYSDRLPVDLINKSKDLFNRYEHIVIVSNNDKSGANLDLLFLDMFGDKVKFIEKSLCTLNDISDEMAINGAEKVRSIVDSGICRIEGRRNLDDDPYRGITKRTGKYIPTGLPSIDDALNDLAPGLVTLIVGRQNGGKTTLTKQIIANAISADNKVYVVSGEGDQETFINEIYQVVIGRDSEYYNSVKINKKFHKEPIPEVLNSLKEWHKGKLTLFNKTDSKIKNTDQLFKMIEVEIKIKKHNLIVMDNLMSLLSVKAESKNESQADFIQRLHELANSYRIHILLILHPNKTYSPGVELEAEMISGTSDLANKADNVISVVREYDIAKTVNGVNGNIKILKNRYYSDLTGVEVRYDFDTGQLLEVKGGVAIGYSFNLGKYLNPGYIKNRNNVDDGKELGSGADNRNLFPDEIKKDNGGWE